MKEYLFREIVLGDEGLPKGPFGSDLKKSLYVPKGIDTYKVYLQENILNETLDAGTHYISKNYFVAKMSRYEVKNNDFIVTCDGTLGEIYQLKNIKEKGIISSSLLRITINPNIVDYDYFYYLFKCLIKEELIVQGNNSVLKHLPGIEVIRNHKIRLPEMAEQKRIGQILSFIDKKIKLNKTINDNLQQLIDSTYSFWFENLNFPDSNNQPYKLNNGNLVFNQLLKREIPVDWIAKPFLDVSYWETNSQPPKSVFRYEPKQGYVRFIQNRDYDSDGYKTYIPYSKSLSIVNKYDILMDKYGDAGTVRYGIEGAFNVALAKIGVNKPNMQEYVRSFLHSKAVYMYLHNACMASTRASLSEENLKSLIIPVPSEYILNKYENYTHSLRKKILSNAEENRKLIKLRDELLPLLMNGQVSVV